MQVGPRPPASAAAFVRTNVARALCPDGAAKVPEIRRRSPPAVHHVGTARTVDVRLRRP